MIGAMLVIPGPGSGTRNPERGVEGEMRIRVAENWIGGRVLDSGFRFAAPE
jgi:hypothetical protein